MVNRNSTSLEHQLNTFLADVFLKRNLANPKLVLAFSGGLDSRVLLHLLDQVQKTLPFQLSAHHVHHGLSPHASAWTEFCADTCQQYNTPLTVTHVNVNKNSGLGLEAAAREARYKALLGDDVDVTRPDFICLAHHQDDQAETFLLQLARGAGVKGLAGMAAINGKWLRPLLNVPRSHVEAYAKAHNLTWIDDESNADTKFDRNFMRHQVLPVLQTQYPAIRQTISRAAQHMAEANDLLDEVAKEDLQACLQNDALHLQPFGLLSKPRQHNALRCWVAQHGINVPSSAQLQQMLQQLLHAKADAAIQIKLSPNMTLRRYNNCAYLVKNLATIAQTLNYHWHGESEVTMPDGSRLMLREQMGAGIALRHLTQTPLVIGYRTGFETMKPQMNRPSRSLKALLHSAQVPPWQRAHWPLLFLSGALVAIPNIALDARFAASANEMGLQTQWYAQ